MLALLASCSSDTIVDPANGNHAKWGDDGGGGGVNGLIIPDDIQFPEDEVGVTATYVNDLNKDFGTLEWQEVVFNIDLRGGHQVISLGPWSGGIEISVSVITEDPVILASEVPEMFAISVQVPLWSPSRGARPTTTGNCTLYQITQLPRNELVNVTVRLPMPGEDALRKANIFWIDEEDNFSEPVGFRPLNANDKNYFTFTSTMDRVHRPDDLTRMVLDPENPGEDE